MPQPRYLSGGWYDIRLVSKGGRVGMINQAMGMGSPSVNARVLGLWWVLFSRIFKRCQEKGEGGTLTRTSIRLSPALVGFRFTLRRGCLYLGVNLSLRSS